MKKLIALTFCFMFIGCSDGQARNKEKILRKALADTNVALGEAQTRAQQYQKAYENNVRKQRKLHHKRTR